MRNVIVTGGSRSLGLGITQKLAASGFRVIAIARRPTDELNAAMEQAAAADDEIHFKSFDLAETAGISGLVKSIRLEFGPLYGLVNNAGLGTGGVLANMPDIAIEKLVRLNVLASIMLTKYASRSMMAGSCGITTTGGRIVNISSVVAATGYVGLAVYSATKASLTGLTKSLARELGPLGITVNAVAPGFIDTEMTSELNPRQRDQIIRRSALRRMAEIEDVANTVDFLFSEKARNITGTQMTVDAGNTA